LFGPCIGERTICSELWVSEKLSFTRSAENPTSLPRAVMF
jgi:hypothetical protein